LIDQVQPLVTIGVASYNNGKYVRETLESIRLQTYPNIEIIIVDDCSTDDSVQVVEQWIAEFPKAKTRFIRHSINRGLCAACNQFLNNANGAYLCIVGSDDVFLPDKTKHQVETLQNAGETYGLVYSDMYIIDAEGKQAIHTQIRSLEPGFERIEGNIFELELSRNRINTPSVMMRTAIAREVGGYDENLSFEDWDMWLRISKSYKVKFSDFISVKYRVLSNSMWSKRAKSFYESSIKILVKHLGHSAEADKVIFREIAEYAQLMYKLYGREAGKWLRFAFKSQPSPKLAILSLMVTLGLPYTIYEKAVHATKV
jgi:glycosyltransferase involved in cell wall biosynthesis